MLPIETDHTTVSYKYNLLDELRATTLSTKIVILSLFITLLLSFNIQCHSQDCLFLQTRRTLSDHSSVLVDFSIDLQAARNFTTEGNMQTMSSTGTAYWLRTTI